MVKEKRQNPGLQKSLQLLIMLAILVVINILASYTYHRFDLTKERRFTLSDATKSLLGELEDVVFVKVYLEGDFPAGFKRLSNSSREMLNEFKAIGSHRIEYEFIDPFEDANDQQKKEIYEQLVKKGLQPTNLKVRGDKEYSEKIIFPGAIFRYRDRELPVHLLQNQVGQSPHEALNASVAMLEYKFAKAIKSITRLDKPKLAFLEGHGELTETEIADVARTLSEFYQMIRLDLTDELFIPQDYDAIVIAKPRFRFSEPDKYKIDQYIMYGGKVLWLIDPLQAEMDSLQGKNEFFAQPYDLKLDDMLFKYGVRINPSLVQDVYCNPVPLVIGYQGDIPQTELYPWYFFPILNGTDNHAIVKNLDGIATEFAGSLDTVGAKNISKRILLQTSRYSRHLFSPVRVNLGLARAKPEPEQFNIPFQNVAVLLEGSFSSVFKNRLAPKTLAMIDTVQQLKFREQGEVTKMIVVADGDVIKNDINADGMVFPLGYYRFTDQTFANKDFIVNALEFLIDDARLIETRSKEVKLRMLDRAAIRSSKVKWQLINVLLPVILILVFGLTYKFVRKKKYAR